MKLSPQQAADKWNAEHPVGSPVIRYKLINPLEDGTRTETRSAAWVLSGHTAVVMVNGVSGCVSLDSVVPITLEFHDDKPDERTDRAVTTQPGDLTTFGSPLKPGS